MRIKSTLFTAITAGIIFLSGIVILGKSALMKRHVAKKGYIPVQEQQQNEDTKIVELLHNRQEELQLATKDAAGTKRADLESRSEQNEQMILLQRVNQLVQRRQTNKVNYTVNKLVRRHEGERMEKPLQVVRKIPTHQEKIVYKIREPSRVKNQNNSLEIINSLEIANNDKGG